MEPLAHLAEQYLPGLAKALLMVGAAQVADVLRLLTMELPAVVLFKAARVGGKVGLLTPPMLPLMGALVVQM